MLFYAHQQEYDILKKDIKLMSLLLRFSIEMKMPHTHTQANPMPRHVA